MTVNGDEAGQEGMIIILPGAGPWAAAGLRKSPIHMMRAITLTMNQGNRDTIKPVRIEIREHRKDTGPEADGRRKADVEQPGMAVPLVKTAGEWQRTQVMAVWPVAAEAVEPEQQEMAVWPVMAESRAPGRQEAAALPVAVEAVAPERQEMAV